MLKNFAQNVFKWHFFGQVYSRFTRDGKMAFFTSQTRPLRWETSQRRQPEVFLAVISLPLAVTDVCRRRILSRLMTQTKERKATETVRGYKSSNYTYKAAVKSTLLSVMFSNTLLKKIVLFPWSIIFALHLTRQRKILILCGIFFFKLRKSRKAAL